MLRTVFGSSQSVAGLPSASYRVVYSSRKAPIRARPIKLHYVAGARHQLRPIAGPASGSGEPSGDLAHGMSKNMVRRLLQWYVSTAGVPGIAPTNRRVETRKTAALRSESGFNVEMVVGMPGSQC